VAFAICFNQTTRQSQAQWILCIVYVHFKYLCLFSVDIGLWTVLSKWGLYITYLVAPNKMSHVTKCNLLKTHGDRYFNENVRFARKIFPTVHKKFTVQSLVNDTIFLQITKISY